MKKLLLLLLVLCLVWAGSVWAGGVPSYGADWHVVAAGGGHAQSANYRLDGTAGQAAVGSVAGSTLRVGAGFWYGFLRQIVQAIRIYLPAIRDNAL